MTVFDQNDPSVKRKAMQTASTVNDVRQIVTTIRAEGRSVGLVPTMGALHGGHLSLARYAREENDFVVMSIFVNPTQFAPNEDLDAYPRRLAQDERLAESAGVNLVFAPDVAEMYGAGGLTVVSQAVLTANLCGASRPTHFAGVLTVVAKLFNIVQPDRAYFGQKDAQQALVIMRMAADLDFPIAIRVCPIVREADGLAISSRNEYLSADEREQATCLSRALRRARELHDAGERDAQTIIREARRVIEQAPLARIDYFSIVDPNTAEDVDVLGGSALAAAAVFFGKTRLIDNAFLGGRPFPCSVEAKSE